MPSHPKHSQRSRAGIGLLAVCLWAGCGDETGPEPPSPAPVATVALNVVNDTFLVRSLVILTPTLRDSAGNTLEDREIAWTTSDPEVGTVAPDGKVTTLALGTVTIEATSEGKSAAALITLIPTVTVSRRLPTAFAGDTTLLTAALTDVHREPVAGGPVTWSSSDESVATVAQDGVVTGVSPGTATILAAADGGSGGVDLVVLDPSPRPNRDLAYLRTPIGASVDELRRVAADGSGAAPVSPPARYVAEYQWSPSGDRIVVAYAAAEGVEASGLYTINPDGSDEREVVPQSVFTTDRVPHPRWSPDGGRLLFAAGSPARIWRVNADGTDRVPLTPASTLQGDDYAPEWSPDGRRIAYGHGVFGCEELWLMDAEVPSSRTRVALPVGMCDLSWSPDGKLIALTTNNDAIETTGIWLMNSDGSNPRPFTPNCSPEGECTGNRDYGHPRWAPDGRRLAYVSAIHHGGSPAQVHVSRLDGTENIAFDIGEGIQSVDWSPDGTRLAFTGRPSLLEPHGVVVSLPDGTGQVPVTSGENAYYPTWRP